MTETSSRADSKSSFSDSEKSDPAENKHISEKYRIISFNRFESDCRDDAGYDKFPEKKIMDLLRQDFASIKNKERQSVRYFGFLNSDKGTKIKFFKDSIYEQYFVVPYVFDVGANRYQKVLNDSGIYNSDLSWSFLYVRIFDKDFLLLDCDLLSDVLKICNLEQDERGNYFSETKIYRCSSKNFDEEDIKNNHIYKTGIYEDDSNILYFSVRAILIASPYKNNHYLVNRVCLLYMLATAYILKIEEFVEEPSIDYKVLNRNYEELISFNLQYFYMIPLKTNRTSQLPSIWMKIYETYRVGEMSKDMSDRISILADYQISKKRSKHSFYLAGFNAVITVLSLIVAICAIYWS